MGSERVSNRRSFRAALAQFAEIANDLKNGSAVRPFSAKSVLPKLILPGYWVPVNIHRAGGGRNRAQSVTRHRNTGC